MPVTAQDFVFSYRRMADPRTAAQYVSILYPIKNMEQAAAGGKLPPGRSAPAPSTTHTLELTFLYQGPLYPRAC